MVVICGCADGTTLGGDGRDILGGGGCIKELQSNGGCYLWLVSYVIVVDAIDETGFPDAWDGRGDATSEAGVEMPQVKRALPLV